MSDLRARIADALGEHARRCDPNHPAYGNCRCGFSVEMPAEHHNHVADALLALPGIAVVDRSDLDQLLAVARLYVNAFSEDELMTLPERMRLQKIEDLLAAADAAEVKQ